MSNFIVGQHAHSEGWVDGPPVMRDDGGLAIVVLSADVKIDGQAHYTLPIIVTRIGQSQALRQPMEPSLGSETD